MWCRCHWAKHPPLLAVSTNSVHKNYEYRLWQSAFIHYEWMQLIGSNVNQALAWLYMDRTAHNMELITHTPGYPKGCGRMLSPSTQNTCKLAHTLQKFKTMVQESKVPGSRWKPHCCSNMVFVMEKTMVSTIQQNKGTVRRLKDKMQWEQFKDFNEHLSK